MFSAIEGQTCPALRQTAQQNKPVLESRRVCTRSDAQFKRVWKEKQKNSYNNTLYIACQHILLAIFAKQYKHNIHLCFAAVAQTQTEAHEHTHTAHHICICVCVCVCRRGYTTSDNCNFNDSQSYLKSFVCFTLIC